MYLVGEALGALPVGALLRIAKACIDRLGGLYVAVTVASFARSWLTAASHQPVHQPGHQMFQIREREKQ